LQSGPEEKKKKKGSLNRLGIMIAKQERGRKRLKITRTAAREEAELDKPRAEWKSHFRNQRNRLAQNSEHKT